MGSGQKLLKYKKKFEHSYSFGAFPTVELLSNRPESVIKVIIHKDASSKKIDTIRELCIDKGISLVEDSRLVERLRTKENCYVVGVFDKYNIKLNSEANHIVLVNPSDMGNLGTIIRTALAFGIRDIAVIEPAVDYFNPRVVRSSMGALFGMNISSYKDFETYIKENGRDRDCYPFMLGGREKLADIKVAPNSKFSLIFGNESSGLDETYLKIGRSVYIEHLDEVDSLNLSIAVGIALHHFYNR